MTKELIIKGMTCEHCVMHVKEALEGMVGVSNVNVVVGKAQIDADDSIDLSSYTRVIDELGYKLISIG